ncbi:cadherin repeat domain-containing protein [Sulfurimonas xiamenensis]|uniref:Cadherin repeat domain-containing protein n=1 Tax=Sulfurimonas xiamenensis TaxID=2590021 RepID=A0AAJ4A396_9BACT|nr:cadherin repeat domain-containing protein [Sulfurimonas xiamenensis]QFR43141.1 cadherin repeat domain-containing protein [Sulfurimonas xiamenensis]
MATGKIVGQIQVTEGNIKIVGIDGVVREPVYGSFMYEDEQIISDDAGALFQIKFLALPEASAYTGVFRILADGSVIHGRDAMQSIASDESLVEILETAEVKEDSEDLETAAGEEEAEGSTAFTETDIVADSSVLGFSRGPNSELGFGITEFGTEDVTYNIAELDVTSADVTPPVITSSNIALFNETDTTPVMRVTASSENAISYSISGEDSELFTIDPVSGVLSFKEAPDYENPKDLDSDNEYNLYVTATDSAGNYTTQLLSVPINNITGNVETAPADSLVLHTFDSPPGNNNEGWIGEGNESNMGGGSTTIPPNELGWFTQDSDTRSHDFDLSDHADEEVNISFTLGVNEWEGDDTFIVRVYDSEDSVIQTQTYSPDSEGLGYYDYDFDVTVPENGIIKVEFQSQNTEDQGGDKEAWSIDNFEISGPDGEQVLTFEGESSSGGTIDIGVLLDQNNDFEGDAPDSIDEIDLSSGDYTLSNITLADVVDITDGDNVLKVTGESGDGVNNLTDNGWIPDPSPTVTEDGYATYTNIDDPSVQLLIDVDIPIETV